MAGQPNGGLVARDVELQLLLEAVDDRGQALVTGEAGVGKSALLEGSTPDLECRGYRCFRATATAGLTEHPFATLGHLLGDLGAHPGPELNRAAVDALCRLAPGSSAVLLLDDVHLIDRWSLHAVLQARAGGGPRIVAAARSVSPLPDRVAALGRGPGIRIELQRLAPSETATLARTILGAPLDTPSAERVHHATDGLPLAITELLRYAQRCGALVERAGLWRWDPRADVDKHLAELLGLRVDALDPAARTALELVSLADQLPADMVTAIVPDADLVDLEAQRLVTAAARPGWVAPAHPLLRDACLAHLAPLQRHDLLTRLGDQLRADPTLDPELERRRVVAAVEIGAPVDDEALVAVAGWGCAHGLWQSMLPVMERAWEQAPSPTTGLAHGEALYWNHRMDEAANVFAAAARLCTSDDERVEIALARARTLNVGLDQWDEATAVRDEARRIVTDDALRLDIAAAEAYELLHRGDVVSTLERCAGAPAPPWPNDAVGAARYRLTQASVGALGLAGRTAEMAAEYALHLDGRACFADRHPLAATAVDSWWVATGLLAGRRDLVHHVLAERYAESVALDDGLTRPVWALPMAIDRWLAGRLDDAELFAREALGVPEEVRTVRRLSEHVLARILELRGRPAESLTCEQRRSHDDYFALTRRWGVGVRAINESAAAGPAVLDIVADGRPGRAAAIDSVASDAAALVDSGQLVPAAYVFHDLLRLGGVGRAAEGLTLLAGRTDSPTVRRMAEHASARAGDEPGRMVDVAADAAAAGDGTLAVHVWRDALAAAVPRRDHRLVAAIERARAATALSGWPEEPAPVPPPAAFGLSNRELEVARAAAAGLTDRQIAEHLVVSVRTVHAHLRSVYRKLDVHRRDELARVPGLLPASS